MKCSRLHGSIANNITWGLLNSNLFYKGDKVNNKALNFKKIIKKEGYTISKKEEKTFVITEKIMKSLCFSYNKYLYEISRKFSMKDSS